MEQRGSGFKKILVAYSSYEKKPVFMTNSWEFTITFPNVNYGSENGTLNNQIETNMFTEQCLYCQRLFSLMKRRALLEQEGQHYSSKRDCISLIRGSQI